MAGLFSRAAETGSPPYVVFDVLQLLALVLLFAMLLPALLSKSVVRMKTWFNLIVACIVYCISFLLLLGHQSGPEPPFQLCVFQAGLIYAAPATVAAAGFAFTIELYLRLSSTLSISEVRKRHITILLFVSPLAHFIVFWVAVFTGLSQPLSPDGSPGVQRTVDGLYCHINSHIPRSGFRGVRLPTGSFPLPLFIRTVLVDILMNSKASASNSGLVVLDLMALIPLSVALVFGSQMDIIGVYMCCKRKGPSHVGKV
ncbi:hypothetical protein C8R47DRAFT_1117553 [Mycena vitilis]|nr:hypothetical protein C8R47DRAFT_1117553 [Mycena vitilis]